MQLSFFDSTPEESPKTEAKLHDEHTSEHRESVTAFLYEMAGYPEVDARRAGRGGVCALCGDTVSELIHTMDSFGSTFTDFDRLVASNDCICIACKWVATGRPPDTLRMWSAVVSETAEYPESHEKAPMRGHKGWHLNPAKKDPMPFIRTLSSPPDGRWCLWIADSGKIHVAPFTGLNIGRDTWSVQLDKISITSTPEEYAEIQWRAAELNAAGLSASSIISMEPQVSEMVKAISAWEEHAAHLMPYAHTPLLHLCAFFLTKGSVNEIRELLGR